MREESKALRERRAKARKEREIKLAVRKPDNRKAQLEMDRRRTEKLI